MDKFFPVPCLWDQTATSLPTDQIWLIAQFLFPVWFVWFHVHFELKPELVHKQYQVSLSQINTALLIFSFTRFSFIHSPPTTKTTEVSLWIMDYRMYS